MTAAVLQKEVEALEAALELVSATLTEQGQTITTLKASLVEATQSTDALADEVATLKEASESNLTPNQPRPPPRNVCNTQTAALALVGRWQSGQHAQSGQL